nr:hypothetical protein [Klebsiella variicola]
MAAVKPLVFILLINVIILRMLFRIYIFGRDFLNVFAMRYFAWCDICWKISTALLQFFIIELEIKISPERPPLLHGFASK